MRYFRSLNLSLSLKRTSPWPVIYINGKWKKLSSVISTTATESQIAILVRSRTALTRFGSDDGFAYQSPPPPYFKRAMVKVHSCEYMVSGKAIKARQNSNNKKCNFIN